MIDKFYDTVGAGVTKLQLAERRLNEVEFLSLTPETVRSLKTVRNILLIFDGTDARVDIGSRCYSHRRPKKNMGFLSSSERSVIESSYVPFRSKFFIEALKMYVDASEMGERPRTVRNKLRALMRLLDWVDGQTNLPVTSFEEFVVAYEAYTMACLDRVRRHQLKLSSASVYQVMVRQQLEEMLPKRCMPSLRSVVRIERTWSDEVRSEPPSIDKAKATIRNVVETIKVFDKFIILERPYPFANSFGSDKLVLLPLAQGSIKRNIHRQARYDIKNTKQCRASAFCFETGEVLSTENIRKFTLKTTHSKCAESTLRIRQSTASTRISTCNNDPFCFPREKITNLYLLAQFYLFIAITGMNLAPVRELKVNGFQIKGARTLFRAVKHRAGGKIVEVTTEKYYTKIFKRYLKIRSLILDRYGLDSFEFVFFVVKQGKIYKAPPNTVFRFGREVGVLLGIDATVTSRQWRAFKGSDISSKYGPLQASSVLQNELKTFLKHYSQPNKEQAEGELSAFFSNYTAQLILDSKEGSTEVTVGRCLEIGNPVLGTGQHYIPDCRAIEGCLFCKNYRVHPDAEDALKLISYEWILKATRSIRARSDYEDELLEGVLKRIDDVLKVISGHGGPDKAEIRDLRSQVLNGKALSPTWQRKAEMLFDLEVL